MDSKKYIIKSKLKIKEETAFGILIESEKSIDLILEEFLTKGIVVKGADTQELGTVKLADGYKSNTNPFQNNIFIITDIVNVEVFGVGDSIEFGG